MATRSRSGTRSLRRSTRLRSRGSRGRSGELLLLLDDLRRPLLRTNPAPELLRPGLRELGAEEHDVRRVVDPNENHRQRSGRAERAAGITATEIEADQELAAHEKNRGADGAHPHVL